MLPRNLAHQAKPAGEKASRLQRLNIGPRLTLCFAFIILAMLVGNAVLLWQFQVVRGQTERLHGVDQKLILVLQAHTNLMAFYERLDAFAHAEDTVGLAREAEPLRAALQDDSRLTQTALSRLPAEVQPDPTLLPTLQAIQAALPAQLDSITVLARSADWEAVRLRLANQVRELESSMSALVKTIDREVGEERAQAVFSIAQAQRRIRLIVPTTAILTLLFATILGWFVTRSIARPLGKLMEGTTALAAGDFTHRVPAAGNDEIGRLGSIFNDMIVRLQGLYRELQQLVDFVPQLIVVLDADGTWLHANRVTQEYTGLALEEHSSAEMIGRVIHPDDTERMRVICEHGLSAADAFELDARLLGKDGVYRWFLFRYNPLVEEGSVKRWYVTATEIEARKQEEERVRKENVRLEERTLIARELHDTILQSFQAASILLAAALESVPLDSLLKPRLDRVLQVMKQGVEEGRNTIQDLRSSEANTVDLVVALSGVQQELAVPPHIDFRVNVAGREQVLRAPVRHEVYRIGREALVNAFSHSRAKRVECELEYGGSGLTMRIRDNGCGMDAKILQSGSKGHWGLVGMRERAARMGGLLKISSEKMVGTEVQLFVPSSIAFQLSPVDQHL